MSGDVLTSLSKYAESESELRLLVAEENNISVDLRSHGIRMSPHIFNDEQDIDQLISVIKSAKP